MKLIILHYIWRCNLLLKICSFGFYSQKIWLINQHNIVRLRDLTFPIHLFFLIILKIKISKFLFWERLDFNFDFMMKLNIWESCQSIICFRWFIKRLALRYSSCSWKFNPCLWFTHAKLYRLLQWSKIILLFSMWKVIYYLFPKLVWINYRIVNNSKY